MEFLFRETRNSARTGGTNRNIGDSIDVGGYVNRVFKVCQRRMNFCAKVLLVISKIARIFIPLAISIRGRGECYSYTRREAMLKNIGIDSYCTQCYARNWNREKLLSEIVHSESLGEILRIRGGKNEADLLAFRFIDITFMEISLLCKNIWLACVCVRKIFYI